VPQSGWLSWRILLLVGCCCEPCARPGAASRVAAWELLLWSLCVHQLEGWVDGRLEVAQQRTWRRLVVLGSHGAGDGAAVLGWWRSGEDGHTGPMVTEEMRLTGPTSRRRPVRERDRRSYPFEGSVVLFRGCGVRAVREWVAQCHGADTDLTAQCRTTVGMASAGGLAK
jgi:hypothetical protein